MDFLIDPTRKNNLITVTITGLDATVEEIQHEEKFGSVSVNAGGTFTGPPPFTLPNTVLQIKMNNQFVHTQTFNANANPRAEEEAKNYINEMTVRILTAKNEWDAQTDTLYPSQFTA